MTDSDDRPTLRLAHSPDPDDVFMWWPLFERDGRPPAIDTGRFRYEPIREDIETLNQRSNEGDLEITAMSCAQYPHVQDRYVITACGASMGEKYGPKLVSNQPMTLDQLRTKMPRIAVPGTRTSAFATLCIMLGRADFPHEVVPFDQIPDAVAGGEFDAGVVIHEGQLTYEQSGLHLIEDLGRWWHEREGLMLPLGVNAVRRDLEREHGEGTLEAIAATLHNAVVYALEHREEAIGEAMTYARGLAASDADRFVRLYVNLWTLDFGVEGKCAVERFLTCCAGAGLTPRVGSIEFIGRNSEAGSPS